MADLTLILPIACLAYGRILAVLVSVSWLMNSQFTEPIEHLTH